MGDILRTQGGGIEDHKTVRITGRRLSAGALMTLVLAGGCSSSTNPTTTVQPSFFNRLTEPLVGLHNGQNIHSSVRVINPKPGVNETVKLKPENNSAEVVLESPTLSRSLNLDAYRRAGLTTQEAEAWKEGTTTRGLEVGVLVTKSTFKTVMVDHGKSSNVNTTDYYVGYTEFNPATGYVTGSSPADRIDGNTTLVNYQQDGQNIQATVTPSPNNELTLQITG